MVTKSDDRTDARYGGFSGYLSRFRSAIPWVVGALLALVAPLASTAFQELLESSFLDSKNLDQKIVWLYFSYFVLFAATVYLMYRVTRWAYRPQTRYLRKDETPEKRTNLFIFMSTCSLDKPERLHISGDLQKDLESLDSIKEEVKRSTGKELRWNREMALRSVAHHLGKLERLTVICSLESALELPDFLSLIQPYTENAGFEVYSIVTTDDGDRDWLKVQNPSKVKGIEFEDFDTLSLELSRILEKMRKSGIREKDINIDFTGGQKVASVVAATLTYNRNIKAQYISTNSLKAISYDVVYGTPQIPSLG